jgi:nucleotide-binding universal stress UspA family protein
MKVLIAIDGSPEASLAIDTAAGLCWPAGSRIDVLTVLPTDADLIGGPWSSFVPTDDARTRIRDEARSALSEATALLRRDVLTVVATIGEGRAATVIVDRAQQMGVDLIVLGARGRSALDRVLLGSVSSEVVDRAHCPVLVARHEWTRRILIGTDGSDEGTAAVDFVCSSGLFTDAEVGVLGVVDIHPDWWQGFTPGDGALAPSTLLPVIDDARRHADAVTANAAERLRASGFVSTSTVREGQAANVIVDEAATRNADLIVVGTRGHGLLKRMLLGSTARSVLHHATVSVLITRGTAIATGSGDPRATRLPVGAGRS